MRIRAISGMTAILKPKLNVTRFRLSADSFPGYRTAVRMYPGKKSKNGIATITRITFDGKQRTTTTKTRTSRLINIRSVHVLILNDGLLLATGQECALFKVQSTHQFVLDDGCIIFRALSTSIIRLISLLPIINSGIA